MSASTDFPSSEASEEGGVRRAIITEGWDLWFEAGGGHPPRKEGSDPRRNKIILSLEAKLRSPPNQSDPGHSRTQSGRLSFKRTVFQAKFERELRGTAFATVKAQISSYDQI